MRSIPGVRLIDRAPFADERGRFVEILRTSELPERFVQANHSTSKKGVLRGLHYHLRQSDLWYVVSGKLQVVLVDLRDRDSKPVVDSLELSEDSPAALYIPSGVAHGFLALSDVELLYWVTAEYDPDDEHGIAWDDPTVNAPWETQAPVLSDRDQVNPHFSWEDIPVYDDSGDD